MGTVVEQFKPDQAPKAAPSGESGGGVTLTDFRSRDPDETWAHVTQYGDHRRIVHDWGDFLYTESTAATELIRVGHMRRSFSQTLHATIRRSTLFLDLSPGDTIRFGRRRSYELSPSRAVVSPAGWDYTRQGSAVEGMGVSSESALLEREIDARVSRNARHWLVQPVPISFTAERRAELAAMLKQLRDATEPDGTWGPYGDLTTFERAVGGWVADLLVGASGVTAATEVSLHRLARLSRWVDLHLAEDITLDRLCAVTGVSWRTLQKSMLAAYGQTPLEFVNARRMIAARKRLESRSSRTQVATIALDCGFRHLGRFAASYREAFGELPSETSQATRWSRWRGASRTTLATLKE